MRKKIIYLGTLFLFSLTFSQVGIDTDTPKATFDVMARAADVAKTDGIIAPRLSGDQLKAKDSNYGADQTGTFVYVTASVSGTPSGKTINVTATGYYYFDGSVWISGKGLKGDQGIPGSAGPPGPPGPSVEIDGIIGNEVLNATANRGLVRSGGGTSANPFTLGLLSGTAAGQSMIWNGTSWNPGNTGNIYNVDGTLTDNRYVTMNDNILSFQNGLNSTIISNNLTNSSIYNIGSSKGSFKAVGGTAVIDIYVDNEDMAQIATSGSSTGLNILTSTATPLMLGTNNDVNGVVISSSNLVGLGRTPTTNRLEVEGQASKTTAGAFIANSDQRLKKDIKPIEPNAALGKLLKLQGVEYYWNDSKTGIVRPTEKQIGFVAQNIQKIFPEKVSVDKLGYLQTAYGDYDAMMVESIRALKNMIDELQQKVAEQQKEIQRLQERK